MRCMRFKEHKLSTSEISALREAGKMLGKTLDPEMEKALEEKGLVTQKLGGLGLTDLGKWHLAKHGR